MNIRTMLKPVVGTWVRRRGETRIGRVLALSDKAVFCYIGPFVVFILEDFFFAC